MTRLRLTLIVRRGKKAAKPAKAKKRRVIRRGTAKPVPAPKKSTQPAKAKKAPAPKPAHVVA